MRLWELLFPEKCILCNTVLVKGRRGICSDCRKKLPYITEPRCLHCGKPISSAAMEYCFDCSGRTGNLERGISLWEYNDCMKRVMADFKYGGLESNAAFFAEELEECYGEKLRDWNIQAIVPVPLYWRKRWFRGYNQAESLSEALGEKLAIPVFAGLLKRSRNTKPQKGLDSRQRRKNLENAFSLGKTDGFDVERYSTVLLVDDIYTTGTTLESCAGVLRGLGIKKVFFACLCTGGDD